jgi:hypothetical protein
MSQSSVTSQTDATRIAVAAAKTRAARRRRRLPLIWAILVSALMWVGIALALRACLA